MLAFLRSSLDFLLVLCCCMHGYGYQMMVLSNLHILTNDRFNTDFPAISAHVLTPNHDLPLSLVNKQENRPSTLSPPQIIYRQYGEPKPQQRQSTAGNRLHDRLHMRYLQHGNLPNNGGSPGPRGNVPGSSVVVHP